MAKTTKHILPTSASKRCTSILMLFAMTALFMAINIKTSFAVCDVPGMNGLVGHWKLDESSGTFADSSGNGNAGTQSGGIEYSSAGIIDDAAGFDGTDDLILVGNIPILTPGPNASWTLSVWAKPADENQLRTLVAKHNWSSPWERYILLIGGDLAANTAGQRLVGNWHEDGSNYRYSMSNADVADGNWHHFVMVADQADDEVKLYMDGVELAKTTSSTGGWPDLSSVHPVHIGENNSGTYHWKGPIDDVRIYNRPLNTDEIKALYAQRSNDTPVAGQIAFNTTNAAMQYCDGTDWRMMGIGSYNPSAVYFDGVNDYLDVQNENLTDTKQVTASFWFQRTPPGTFDSIWGNSNAGSRGFKMTNDVSDQLVFWAHNSAGGLILQVRSSVINDSDWHHALVSFDLSDTTKRHIYIDGVSDLNTVSTYTDDLISVSTIDMFVAGSGSGAAFDGSLADLWIDYGTYIDLSIENNRRKFLSKNGMPMYLGPDGSIPTGQRPEVFLSGDALLFASNRGLAGGFTENGAMITAPTQPASASFISAGSWSQLGNSLDLSGAGQPSITALDSTTIAYIDDTNDDLRTYSWDGVDWSQVGNDLNITNVGTPSISALDSTTIAYFDATNDDFRTYSWDGSDWSQVGNDLNITAGVGYLKALDISTVAFFETLASELRTYSWDGSDWSQVGNGLNISGLILSAGLAALDSTTIAYYDGANDDLRTYSWDGSNWSQVGNDLNITSSGAYLAALNSTKIAYYDHTNDDLRTYSWDGNDWSQVGSDLNIPGAIGLVTGLTALNGQSVAFTNQDLDNLETYRFSSCLKSGVLKYSADFNVMQYCNGVEWIAMGPIGGTVTTNGLVGHWDLDETSGATIDDSTAQNNDGTWNDNANNDVGEETTSAKVGTGLSFDGTDDYIDIGDQAVHDMGAGEWALSVWVKFTYTPSTGDGILNKRQTGPGNTGYGINTTISQGKLECEADDDVTDGNYFSKDDLNDGEWHHIVCMRDNSTNELRMYVNGIAETPYDITGMGSLDDTTAKLFIGSRESGGGSAINFFQGDIDEAYIYNRALTESEVQALYNHGLSGGLGDISGGCTSPVRAEGVMLYNADENLMQYCNGENWIGIGK